MTDSDFRQTCARRLREASSTLQAIAPLTDEFNIGEDDAYAIQRHNVELRLTEGASLVGWKVGLTSDAIQSWLGVSEPDFGALLDDMSAGDGETVDTGQLLQPRAEAELAFLLRDDLPPDATAASVLAATEWVAPAIEIIDSRVADWKIKWGDTVADNASSGMFVLGSASSGPQDVDLRRCGMLLRKNGRVVSTGAGAACLGNPVNAVVWLARTLGRFGQTLRAGHVVLSGALGPVTPVAAGDWLQASISGVGDVGCRFR